MQMARAMSWALAGPVPRRVAWTKENRRAFATGDELQTIWYLLVLIATIYLSGLQNKWRVSKVAAVFGVGGALLASPFLVALAAVLVSLLQLTLLLIGLALFAISKWKLIVLLKLKALFAVAAGVVLTPFTAGLIWFLIFFFFAAMLLGAIKDWTTGIYTSVSRALVRALIWTRARGDSLRSVPGIGAPLALGFEFPIVAALPVWGLWETFSWVEGTGHPTAFDWWTKAVFGAGYAVIVYRLFLAATRDGGTPGTGLDMPDVFPER
jgi:hypothetical protein